MYTDEEMNMAVKQKIFSQDAVSEFRQYIDSTKNTVAVDEENFRLLTGFNDIFVTIACILLLFSVSALLGHWNTNMNLLLIIIATIAWGLAEFFVLKRRLALTAIILLLSFSLSVYTLFSDNLHIITATILMVLILLGHWLRFKVPITITACFGAMVYCVMYLVIPETWDANIENTVYITSFASGIVTFLAAMYWDLSDPKRETRNSDVAFWLHLLAAPLIIYPVFTNINDLLVGVATIIPVILFYLLIAIIAIIINRRSFIVSSSAYILFEFAKLFKAAGELDYGFALSGTFIGLILLLLSVYWHSIRKLILKTVPVPENIRWRLPV